jgi:DNA-binding NarL/FixJ family response regulator
MKFIKVIVVDDHKLFRNGIISLLENDEDIEIIGEAASGIELLNILSEGIIPHIVLLDLSMPEMGGLEVLKIAKKKYKTVKFIAISMHDEGQYVVNCIKNGAQGYLLKMQMKKS